MELVKLVLVGACLSASLNGSTAALNVQPRPDLHLAGSSLTNDSTKPVVLKFSLSKNGTFVRSCYGAHIDVPQIRIVYWIMPAECLDQTKYDNIAVKYGYKENHDAKFNLKDIYIRIFPWYNNDGTKAHNIASVVLRRQSYMDPERGYSHILLPRLQDKLDDKILEIYEYKNTQNGTNGQEEVSLFSIKTKAINSIWCKLAYLLSPIKKYHVCASGWSGKGLTEDDLGTPLIMRDGNTFKLVGLATFIRPWAHRVNFPMEFLSIKPYLNWIGATQTKQNKAT